VNVGSLVKGNVQRELRDWLCWYDLELVAHYSQTLV